MQSIRKTIFLFSLWICIPALATYYAYPPDPWLTGDSLEYIARAKTSPLHPHHLLWVSILDTGQKTIQWITTLDRVRSSQIFLAILSSTAVFLFGLALRRGGGHSSFIAAGWALIFGLTAGYTVLAQETESYNVAIGLCLASILLIPLQTHTNTILPVWRYIPSILCFVLAVCVHQLFAVAVIPFCFYLWNFRWDGVKTASVFAGLSGLICLGIYLIAYQCQPNKSGFLSWLTLYSHQMPLFGKFEHFITPYFIHRLVANLLAALVYDPVPALKTAVDVGLGPSASLKLIMGGGYALWVFIWISALMGILSKKPLYRFFAAWFITFEIFLWYWAPWLLQMQVLIVPAIIGTIAFSTQKFLTCLPFIKFRFSAPVIILSALLLLISVQVIFPPRLGHLTLREAASFYENYPGILKENTNLMLLHEYSKSWPYIILAEDDVTQMAVFKSEVREGPKSEIRRNAVKRGTAALRSENSVIVHNSMPIAGGKDETLNLIEEILQSRPDSAFHIKLLETTGKVPVAIAIKQSDSMSTHPALTQISTFIDQLITAQD